MLDQVERAYIKKLEEAGLTQEKIARRTGHARKTIRRVVKEPTGKEYPRKKMGSIVDRYAKDIRRWIRGDLTVKRMLEKVREDADHPYEGSKTTFYDRVKLIREEMDSSHEAIIRFETLPGEQLQADWGDTVIDYDNDEKTKEHFFATRMKYSRHMYVDFREDMKLETLINCLLKSFEDLQGVPLTVSFDNMKTVVKTPKKKKNQDWNQTFFKFATELGFYPTLCTPEQPNQKGSAENLVRYVKNNFLAGRCFKDRNDLENQLQKWLSEVNEVRPSQAHGKVPDKLLEEERDGKLKPLVATSVDYGLLRYLTVNREGTVRYETNEYSVPVELIGKTLEVRVHPERIRIYHEDELVADHERSTGRKERIRVPEHYKPTFKKKPRGQLMLYRETLLNLNHGISDYVEEMIRKNVANQRPHVVGIYNLLKEHGEDKLAKLCNRCARDNLYGIDYLTACLENDQNDGTSQKEDHRLNLLAQPDQVEVDRDMSIYEKLAKGGGS